jgi:metal-dependent amidase/aminoacylase/carboxypeptidase family protein
VAHRRTDHGRAHDVSAAPVALADRLRRWRHDLHQISEIGLTEPRTSDHLAAETPA